MRSPAHIAAVTFAALAAATVAAAADTARAATGPGSAFDDTPANPPPVAAPPSEPARIGNPLWAIPLKSLNVTRERPLFAPSRRPPPMPVLGAPVVAPPPPPRQPIEETPRLSLVGAIVAGKDGIAVLQDVSSQEVLRLKIGEAHGGWVLTSVRRREVVLERSGKAVVVAFPTPQTQPEPQ